MPAIPFVWQVWTLAAELQLLSFVFPASLPCSGQELIGTMCEPGDSPDPQDLSANNVLKLLLGDRTGDGWGERGEVWGHFLQMFTVPGGPYTLLSQAQSSLENLLSFRRPSLFVVGQHFSEKRHLPLSWHGDPSVCSLVAVCIGTERCCNLRLAYIFGRPGHWRVNWGFSLPLLAAFFGLVFSGWCLLEGGVEEKDTYSVVCFSTWWESIPFLMLFHCLEQWCTAWLEWVGPVGTPRFMPCYSFVTSHHFINETRARDSRRTLASHLPLGLKSCLPSFYCLLVVPRAKPNA